MFLPEFCRVLFCSFSLVHFSSSLVYSFLQHLLWICFLVNKPFKFTPGSYPGLHLGPAPSPPLKPWHYNNILSTISDYNGDDTPIEISALAGSSAIMQVIFLFRRFFAVKVLNSISSSRYCSSIIDRATLPALDGGIVFFSTFVVVEKLVVTFMKQRHLCDGEDCYWHIDSRRFIWPAWHRDVINTARASHRSSYAGPL